MIVRLHMDDYEFNAFLEHMTNNDLTKSEWKACMKIIRRVCSAPLVAL